MANIQLIKDFVIDTAATARNEIEEKLALEVKAEIEKLEQGNE